jgi:hypothetical protein
MDHTDDIDGRDPVEAAPAARGRRHRRALTVAVVLAAGAGAGLGATAIASAATAPSTTAPASGGSSPTTVPGPRWAPGFPGRGGPHGFAGGFLGGLGGGFGGPVVHGQYTVKGPSGYETIDVRTGTVSAVTHTSGTTWSLTVKSDDSTSGTFTVNSSTSVNGGESGIASVKSGDTVVVTATGSGDTPTATQITDTTTLQANGKAWLPMRPPMAPGATPAGPEGGATTSTT